LGELKVAVSADSKFAIFQIAPQKMENESLEPYCCETSAYVVFPHPGIGNFEIEKNWVLSTRDYFAAMVVLCFLEIIEFAVTFWTAIILSTLCR